MGSILNNCRVKNKLLHILSYNRSFSAHKVRYTTPAKDFDKALRVLDIIAPKTSTRNRQSHLRLIQDFLQTNPNQESEQYFSCNFTASRSEVIPNVLDELIELSPYNQEHEARCFKYDAGSLSNAVSWCASFCDLRVGTQYHCLAINTGFAANAYVGSSLITLYGKCGELNNAYKVFYEIPVRNVVSWTAIISRFAQEGKIDVCLELFSAMRNSTLAPNDFTFTSLLSACTGGGALGQGRSTHGQIIQMGFDSYSHIANALISMYFKCGSINDALYIFENMSDRDIVSWNSMISGYAQHGLTVQAIEVFEKMKNLGIKPDSVTFLGVLSSCRHAGFVEAGRGYFHSMIEYGVRPELDHYSCLVDLLGRAGLIEEAQDIILRMPLSPNAVIWGSLLSSCRLHGSVWIGIEAARNRLLLQPDCAAAHVQLANLYASARCWDQAARVRKLMKDRGLRTNPGNSWIEIENKVYRFKAEDGSNRKFSEILVVLDCLLEHMTTLRFVAEIYVDDLNDRLKATTF